VRRKCTTGCSWRETRAEIRRMGLAGRACCVALARACVGTGATDYAQTITSGSSRLPPLGPVRPLLLFFSHFRARLPPCRRRKVQKTLRPDRSARLMLAKASTRVMLPLPWAMKKRCPNFTREYRQNVQACPQRRKPRKIKRKAHAGGLTRVLHPRYPDPPLGASAFFPPF